MLWSSMMLQIAIIQLHFEVLINIINKLQLAMAKLLDKSTHTLNTSTSKTKYSFSKADRFHLQFNAPLCDVFYELPNLKSKRATSFGIGKRNPEKNTTNIPSPKYYNKRSQFDQIVKKRGFSFGFGRDEVVAGSITDRNAKQLPGPGLYTINSFREGISITMKSRNLNNSLKQQQLVPGPGSYDTNDHINSNGRYFSSKYLNSRVGRFNPIPKNRSFRTKSGSPGPGRYNYVPGTTQDGKHFISKFQNSMVSTFSKSSRPEVSLKHLAQTPGPGSYQIFSEFQASTD